METYQVLDIIENMVVFIGSLEECSEWVNSQSDFFTYEIQPKIN